MNDIKNIGYLENNHARHSNGASLMSTFKHVG